MKRSYIGLIIFLLLLFSFSFGKLNSHDIEAISICEIESIKLTLIECGDNHLDNRIFDVIPCSCGEFFGDKQDCVFMTGKCCSEYMISECNCN